MVSFHIRSPWIHVVYDLTLTVLWGLNIRGQTSGDDTDPAHSCQFPWYLEKSCSDIPYYEYRCCVLSRLFLLLTVLAV